MFPRVRFRPVPNPDVTVLISSWNTVYAELSSHLVEKTTSRVALCYEGKDRRGLDFCGISLGLRNVDVQTVQRRGTQRQGRRVCGMTLKPMMHPLDRRRPYYNDAANHSRGPPVASGVSET